jgi:hypothetical protein
MIKFLITVLCAICFSSNAVAFGSFFTCEIETSINPSGKSATTFHSKKKKKNWSKDVWSVIELDQKINTAIFLPYNKKRPGFDYGSQEIKSELFETQKAAIKWNLWTILMRNFFKGDLTLYSPYDPNWQNNHDGGFLIYPITPDKFGSSPDGTFETDPVFKDKIESFGFLGHIYYDPFAMPLQSWEYPGEDSVIVNDRTGFLEAVYPPSEFLWVEDSDILAYKIKEKWILDENGNVLDKMITSIAPIVMEKDDNGNEMGKKELFWIDFNELTEMLEPYFIKLDRYKKDQIISLHDFFDTREFYASEIANDSIWVKAVVE